MAETWPSFVPAMAEPWPTHGQVMASPWPSRGQPMVRPWPWYTKLSQPTQKTGTPKCATTVIQWCIHEKIPAKLFDNSSFVFTVPPPPQGLVRYFVWSIWLLHGSMPCSPWSTRPGIQEASLAGWLASQSVQNLAKIGPESAQSWPKHGQKLSSSERKVARESFQSRLKVGPSKFQSGPKLTQNRSKVCS